MSVSFIQKQINTMFNTLGLVVERKYKCNHLNHIQCWLLIYKQLVYIGFDFSRCSLLGVYSLTFFIYSSLIIITHRADQTPHSKLGKIMMVSWIVP